MREQTALTPISEALAAIERAVHRLPVTRLPLEQAAGLTLATGIVCDIDYPPFDKAMMDGFAVRAADCRGAGTTLRVTGELAAGQVAADELLTGDAVRINTGAPLPPGADAVVVIEHVELYDDGLRMSTPDTPSPGTHVARRGSDVRAGAIVLEAGTRLGPAQVAAAAAAGAAQVEVYRRPRMAVLVTGDELVPIGKRPTGAQIRNSNGPALAALARQAGCEVIDLGIAGDDRAQLADKVAAGLQADVLCISGGVSMGQHDYVPEVLEQAGVRFDVRKVAIRPGKPIIIGVGPAGQMVFGLPGNPVSSFVCFLVFVRAAVAGLQGRAVTMPPMLSVTLDAPLPAAGQRTEFLPAQLTAGTNGEWRASPTRWQGSGDLFGLARSNGLLVREVNAPAAEAGVKVPAILFETW